MRSRLLTRSLALASVLITGAGVLVASPAGAANTLTATASFPASLSGLVPLVRLTFNQDVAAAELPKVATSPKLTVTWQQIGPKEVQAVTSTTEVPSVSYLLSVPTVVSCTTYCVTVHRVLHRVSAFGSELWLQELLARLNYLPVSFTASAHGATRTAYVPGTFSVKYPDMPTVFRAMWHTGQSSLIMTGALMRFQSEHNLTTSGVANAATWSALLSAAQVGQVNATPYDWVYVTKSSPEHLTLWRNGKVLYHSLVNTGISSAPTQAGTFPVYLRFTSTTMSGTNPDGSHYSDPGIPWVSYFNGGDALHGFIRSSYGWPQSLGCVEMPFANAAIVWKYTPIGTLVSVS